MRYTVYYLCVIFLILQYIHVIHTQDVVEAAAIPTDPAAPIENLPAATQDPVPVSTQAVVTTPPAEAVPTPVDTPVVQQPVTSADKGNGATVSGNNAAPTGSTTTKNETEKKEEEGEDKTGVIAGALVGCIVAIAALAGILTWLNRRGGCTSRTRRRDMGDEFEGTGDMYDSKMPDNEGGTGRPELGMVHASAIHSSDNLSPSSPYQNGRRFAPPTMNSNGYMDLTDDDHGYYPPVEHNQYQPQLYSDYRQNNQGFYGGNGVVYQQQDYYPPSPFTQHSNMTSPTFASNVPTLTDVYQPDQKPNSK
ncbi:hypothetical protein BDB01DRAFT_336785 [Pilobolus umbonatus]|nr:hypothetical protein BDB01DRAFT_336785 [Pilobolus umbonatus]